MSPLDTQKLDYSNLTSSSDEETSSDESLPDASNLKAYDFEPVCKPKILIEKIDNENEEKIRIGNTDWCLCGKCEEMETHTESLCCQDTNEVTEELFEGINSNCIRKINNITGKL
jgi:hypothetical protein